MPTSELTAGGGGQGTYTPTWNTTPPMIALASKALETAQDSYHLTATITAEHHVEDAYVFVSNQGAKIESRKVFYRSNRGGKNGRQLELAADLPLWPGSNMVTVVARSSADVRSIKTIYVYRDAPRTARVP